MTTTHVGPIRAFDRLASNVAVSGGPRLDAVMSALCLTITGGVIADGWSHIRYGADQTVFSPYHLTFYSGAICVLVVLTAITAARLREGFAWSDAVPTGYRGAMVGAAAFLISGALDLAGHAAFGFETGLEIVVSPTHLVLFACWIAAVTGPVFSIAYRTTDTTLSLVESATLAVSAACTAVALTASLSPFAALSGIPVASTTTGTEFKAIGDSLGIARVLVQTAILVGVLMWVRSLSRSCVGFNFIYLALFGTLIAGLREQWWLIWFCAAVGVLWEALPWLGRWFVGPHATDGFTAMLGPLVLWVGAYAKFAFVDDDFTWDFYLWSGSIAEAVGVGALLYVAIRRPSTLGARGQAAS